MIDPLIYGQRQWQSILLEFDADIRQAVARLVAEHSQGLADHFYVQMMDMPEARGFLEHDMVNQRLKQSMVAWLTQVFAVQQPEQIPAAVERQFEVGQVHARINLPVNLVSAGARLHKKRLLECVTRIWRDPADWLQASGYLLEVIDLTQELMNLAYVTKADRKSRAAEAYRLHTLGLNLSVERERQRASLLDWSQALLFALHQPGALPGTLRQSEFGLWFNHQAVTVFDGAPELAQIEQLLQRIDEDVLTGLQAAGEDKAAIAEQMSALQQDIRGITWLLNTLFDRFIELEHGRDTLTRLLDRRFLPAVLNREVRLAMRSQGTFSVVLFDIDHFKAINDSHGHEGGDMVLQQVASLITGAVRSSDFCFRYGGEELLVVLVEAAAEQALAVADKVRERLADAELQLPENQRMKVTVSGGVATFDGHPDYEYLIKRADQALYRAKREGRNRCLAAPSQPG